VAAGTFGGLVFAFQAIVSIAAVIEQRLLPSIGAVTPFALGAELSTVPVTVVVLLVTGIAILGRVLVISFGMAFLAFCLDVLARELEFRILVMVEAGFPPLDVVVAILALLA